MRKGHLKMDREEFIRYFMRETGFSFKKSQIINDVFENNFVVGENHEEQIVLKLKDVLEISIDEARDIYNHYIDVLVFRLKYMITH